MSAMKPSHSIPRRRFLQAAAAGAAPLILPKSLFGATAPSRTLQVAIAGGGTRCRAHAGMFSRIPGVRVVAVCDVWPKRAAAAKGMIDKLNGDTKCKSYHDFREMIAESDAAQPRIVSSSARRMPPSCFAPMLMPCEDEPTGPVKGFEATTSPLMRNVRFAPSYVATATYV